MLQQRKITDAEATEFAEVFAYYEYGDKEVGMVPYYPGYPDRTRLVNYLKVMINTANRLGAIYTTSDKNEGIIIITNTKHPYPGSAVFGMMIGMVKALGIKGFKDIMKKFHAGGMSLENKYRKEKKDFVQVELLAIKKEYQGKGFMRPLVETAFEIADEDHLPVIISTDAELKKDKYVHLGMSLVNVRDIAEGSHMYDMVREAR